MMKTCGAIVLAVLLMTASGCVPFKFVERSALQGQVIDQKTRLPIAYAQIYLYIYHYNEPNELEIETVTNESGEFGVSEKSHTVWAPLLPYDYFPPPRLLRVKADGYQEFQHLYGGDHINIELPKKEQTDLKPQATIHCGAESRSISSEE